MTRTTRILGALAALAVAFCFARAVTAQQPADDGKRPQGEYVILTDIKAGGAYDKVVTEFKKLLHPEAKVVRYDPAKWEELKKSLRGIKPRYVTVVLRPDTLDVNFQGMFLKLCTEMDDDPLCDFSYGYVTGATEEEAVKFVKNIAKAAKQGLPHRILAVPTIGSGPEEPSAKSTRTETTGINEGYFVDWPVVRVTFGETDKKHMTPEEITAWMTRNISDFSGNGVIMMGGHGSPRGIVGNISAADVRKLDLTAAVVFNYACLTGCVSRAYDWIEEEDVKSGAYVNIKEKKVEPTESIALSVIAAGASAYVASIEPRLAGPAMTGELAHALAEGVPLGDVRRREYDMLIMAYLGWGEKSLVITPFADGTPRNEAGKDPQTARRNRLMMSGVGTVLFGDPALKICRKNMSVVTTKLSKADKGYSLECETDPAMVSGIYCYLFDQYQHNAGGEDGMAWNMRLYATADLPKDVKPVTGVELVEATGADGAKIETRYLAWSVEESDGGRRLHVKV
ncbi:MAG: hypothetical protein RDV41_03750, partial [Planctomycetota bacterium]|nr:hypothetical protein [Planctomycetota bacterium]